MREVLAALQTVSSRPLVLREVPLRSTDSTGEEIVTGYVDLVSERAYGYKPGQPSELIKMPEEVASREQEARRELLESLADFDDKLLEQLLEDAVPSKDEIYQQLSKDLADDLIVPVFFGSAERDNGVRRLLKALRHEVPGPEATAARLGLVAETGRCGGPGVQDLSHAPYRQAVAGPRAGRQADRRHGAERQPRGRHRPRSRAMR